MPTTKQHTLFDIWLGYKPIKEYRVGNYLYALWNNRNPFSVHEYLMDVVSIKEKRWFIFWKKKRNKIIATFKIKIKTTSVYL